MKLKEKLNEEDSLTVINNIKIPPPPPTIFHHKILTQKLANIVSGNTRRS